MLYTKQFSGRRLLMSPPPLPAFLRTTWPAATDLSDPGTESQSSASCRCRGEKPFRGRGHVVGGGIGVADPVDQEVQPINKGREGFGLAFVRFHDDAVRQGQAAILVQHEVERRHEVFGDLGLRRQL